MASSGSIRRRLLALLLGVVASAWGAVAVLTYFDAHREIDALLDAHLAQSARLLIVQAGDDLREVEIGEEEESDSRYAQTVAFQVWERGERLLLRSANAPGAPFADGTPGFSEAERAGARWRVYSGWDEKRQLLVEVAEDHASRSRIARSMAWNSLLPLLFVLPLLGVAVWWVVGHGLRPLQDLAAEVARRGPLDLAPLAPPGLPAEVAGLASRLDQLLARIRESLESERRFTSHAAHELRTPVAAIRAQAEVARAAADATVRDAALDHVIEGCDRAARLVDQLLVLARADEAMAVGVAVRVDQVAERVLAELAPVALRQGTTVALEHVAPAEVACEPALLEALVRNLVDNAIRHGGAHGRVATRVEAAGTEVVLRVDDTGPGVPEAELRQLGQRFYRGPGARGTGSGLGLSIVTRIVEVCRGTVRFARGPDGRGFSVEVRLPRRS